MRQGIIFDIQRFSIQDGPGIRTTVFLKGCPLACAWCHNPESRRRDPEVMTLEHRCIRCGACVESCPAEVPATQDRIGGEAGEAGPAAGAPPAPLREPLPAVPRAACTTCGRCVEACPTGARQMVGRTCDVDALTNELLRDRPFFEESGGGVTFSGGEPLAQRDFLLAALEAAQALGLHCAVDTSGFAPRQDLRAVAEHTDLFLYDLKLVDDERHRRCTGVSNALILENLEMLAREHGNLWIRIPVVPGFNDDDAAALAAAAFLASLPGIREVQLLPYHATGEPKFARLGLAYGLSGAAPPGLSRLEQLAGIYRDAGLTATITR